MDDFTDKVFTQLLNQLAKQKLPHQSPRRKALASEIHHSETIVHRYFQGDRLGGPSKGFQQLLSVLLKDKGPSYTATVLAAYLEFVLKHSGDSSAELQSAATYLKELALRDKSNQPHSTGARFFISQIFPRLSIR